MLNPAQIVFQEIVGQYANPIFLKQGGQKVVFRVNHPLYGDSVLKIGTYDSPNSLQRIRREVLLLREIDSEYYPRNFDFKEHPHSVFEIVEEFVESVPLSEVIGQYDLLGACLLISRLVEGLKVIWKKRTVHRDLKPDNILITPDGLPKIIDLGIARQMDLDSLTYTIQARGPCTAFYAAPEQLSNRKTEISPRTDQFNLGIILMQMILRGGHPFASPGPDGGGSIVDNIVAGNWNTDVLRSNPESLLRPIVQRLLGTEPYQRYRDPEMLTQDLDVVIANLKNNGYLSSTRS